MAETKKAKRERAIAAGRKNLRAFLDMARERGTIYYTIKSVSRSGMMRTIQLYTVNAKREIVAFWPSVGSMGDMSGDEYSSALDAVAKDLGFSFDVRAFRIGGCGMDMVFALVDNLANRAYGPKGKEDYANAVRRESL